MTPAGVLFPVWVWWGLVAMTAGLAMMASAKPRFIVLPESALGFWTPTVARLWQQGLRGSELIVIANAAFIDPGG